MLITVWARNYVYKCKQYFVYPPRKSYETGTAIHTLGIWKLIHQETDVKTEQLGSDGIKF